MKSTDLSEAKGFGRQKCPLGDLMRCVLLSPRSDWTDLTQSSGIYAVVWPNGVPIQFRATPGQARFARATTPGILAAKWQSINNRTQTDMGSLGKADSLRARVRLSARFGVGRTRYHGGGEWLWQLIGIDQVVILAQPCPLGKQIGFENAFLERFSEEHDELPLANRAGPRGVDRWWPA